MGAQSCGQRLLPALCRLHRRFPGTDHLSLFAQGGTGEGLKLRTAALQCPPQGAQPGSLKCGLPAPGSYAGASLAPTPQPKESMRPRWRGWGVGTLKVRLMLDISLRSCAPETQSWTCSRAYSTASWTPTKMASRPASQWGMLGQEKCVRLLHGRHMQGQRCALHDDKRPPQEVPHTWRPAPHCNGQYKGHDLGQPSEQIWKAHRGGCRQM